MNVLSHISDIIIPILLFYIIGYGIVSRVKVYEAFLTGAKEGLKVVVDIMPTLVGLLVAVGVLRASGFLDFLSGLLAPLAEPAGIPAPVVPVMLIKLFSGSAATGLVLDVFRTYGPDSYIGTLVSILMSCTDNMVILRGNEECLQRQGLEFVLRVPRHGMKRIPLACAIGI